MADPTITIQGLIDGSQPILGTSFPLTKGEKEGLDYMDVFDQINGTFRQPCGISKRSSWMNRIPASNPCEIGLMLNDNPNAQWEPSPHVPGSPVWEHVYGQY